MVGEKVSDTGFVVAVALALRVTPVIPPTPIVTPSTVVPAVMPVPLTVIPGVTVPIGRDTWFGCRLKVTTADALVVAQFRST